MGFDCGSLAIAAPLVAVRQHPVLYERALGKTIENHRRRRHVVPPLESYSSPVPCQNTILTELSLIRSRTGQ